MPRVHSLPLFLLSILASLSACSSPDPVAPETEPVISSQPTPNPDEPPFFDPNILDECNPDAAVVKSDGSSLVITDPAILSQFSLERVLDQIISTSPLPNITPLELLQRIFDTENTAANGIFADGFHCDAQDNPAFVNGASKSCPRAEGALATNPNLLKANDPDSFIPVALVNRSDLTPSTLETCGEYRIVFAKRSGLQDPQNRAFLIFEAALTNNNFGLAPLSCLPLARKWATLESATDTAQKTKILEDIFFNGVDNFAPAVHADHYGRFAQTEAPYHASRGQIRLSQGMQEPWEMREFHLMATVPTPDLLVKPVPVKNNPLPELFDNALQTDQAIGFRNEFVGTAWSLAQSNFMSKPPALPFSYNAGESSVTGEASVNYAERAASNTDLLIQLDQQIEFIGNSVQCPPNDSLIAEDLIRRASVQTCAGCHAPTKFLGPSRDLGCGATWPDTLGQVHIDEHGKLSPSLTTVFLPQRASILSTYLKACDITAIWGNLVPVQGGIPD